MPLKKISLIIVSALIGVQWSVAQITAPHVANELLIKFKDEPSRITDPEALSAFLGSEIAQLAVISKTEKIGQHSPWLLVSFKPGIELADLMEGYLASGLFLEVEPNYIATGGGVEGTCSTFPDDTYFDRQYGFYNDGSFGLGNVSEDADVDMELAWDIEKGDSTIVIAVMDAGTKLDHPELINRLWINPADTLDGMDNDGNGLVDDIYGWDYVNQDNDPTDDLGHGTNIAGILCSEVDNDLGYAGADWNAKLMTVKCLNSNNSATYANMANAFYYAADQGAHLANMSIGGSSFSVALANAVTYAYDKGMIITACMMNFNDQVSYYPAALAKTIAVGSTDANDERTAPFFWSSTSGSNFGTHIDVVAPGNYIYGLDESSNTNYDSYWGGTSQAAPLVCGVAALLKAQDTGRSVEDIRNILQLTAEDEVGRTNEDVQGFDIYHGWGRVNAYQALLFEANVGVGNMQYAFRMFPNPAQDQLWIKSPKRIESVLIYDMKGQLVLESSQNLENAIDISQLASGVYTVHLKSEFNHQNQKLLLH